MCAWWRSAQSQSECFMNIRFHDSLIPWRCAPSWLINKAVWLFLMLWTCLPYPHDLFKILYIYDVDLSQLLIEITIIYNNQCHVFLVPVLKNLISENVKWHQVCVWLKGKHILLMYIKIVVLESDHFDYSTCQTSTLVYIKIIDIWNSDEFNTVRIVGFLDVLTLCVMRLLKILWSLNRINSGIKSKQKYLVYGRGLEPHLTKSKTCFWGMTLISGFWGEKSLFFFFFTFISESHIPTFLPLALILSRTSWAVLFGLRVLALTCVFRLA